jgi:hypothetical protein
VFKRLNVWWIVVDPDLSRPNREAQQSFICGFGTRLYGRDASDPLAAIEYPYFTRIFDPPDYPIGTFVRFYFFVDEDKREAAERELDSLLGELKKEKLLVETNKKEVIDGIVEASEKGAGEFPELYFQYMSLLSRTSVRLFSSDGAPDRTEKVVVEWAHNLLNLLHNYQMCLIQFPAGTKISLKDNHLNVHRGDQKWTVKLPDMLMSTKAWGI